MSKRTKVILYGVLLLVAIAVRNNLPSIPMWDGDSTEYLSGLLRLLQGGDFRPPWGRSIIYPLLLLPFLALTKSIATIAFLQKLSGVISIAAMMLIWEKATKKFRYRAATFLIGYSLIFLYSISTTVLAYELTILPEAFATCFSLILIYLMVTVMQDDSDLKQKHLLPLILCLDYVIYCLRPRWGFAAVIPVGFVVWQYYHSHMLWREIFRSAVAPVLLLFIVLIIPDLYFHTKPSELSVSGFGQTQFFYVNVFLLEKDINKILPDSSLAALAKQELTKAKDTNTMLGYNPDMLMYGLLRDSIQKKVFPNNRTAETQYYASANRKLFAAHPRLFLQKIIKQVHLFSFYVLPRQAFENAALNLEDNYRKSFQKVEKLHLKNPAFLDLDQYSNTAYYDVRYNLYQINNVTDHVPGFIRFAIYISPFLFGFWVIVRYRHIGRKYHKGMLIAGLLAGQILTVACVHTFDNNRYYESLKPFWILLCAFSLCSIIDLYPAALTTPRFKNYTQAHPWQVVIIVLLVCQFLYYKNQYHLFEPFLQAWPNKYELSDHKDSNEIRILCLGGSTTAGKTLSDSCRYPYLLEKKLQAIFPGKKIRVLNLGMDWYTSKHLLINYTTEARHYQPDIVICMEAINDMYRSFAPRLLCAGPYNDQYTHFYGPSIYGANPPTAEFYLLSKSIFGDIPSRFINQQKVHYPLSEFKSIKPYIRNISSLATYVEADSALFILVTQPNLYKTNMTQEEVQHCWFNTAFCNRRIAWNKMEYPDVPSMTAAMNMYLDEERKKAIDKGIMLIDAERQVPKSLKYFTDEVHHSNYGADTLSSIIAVRIASRIKMGKQ